MSCYVMSQYESGLVSPNNEKNIILNLFNTIPQNIFYNICYIIVIKQNVVLVKISIHSNQTVSSLV